jgi:hypothetical protein
MCGPRSPQAPGGHGGVCLLASRPVCDPVRGVVDSTALAGQRRGAHEPWWLGTCLLVLGPWLASKASRRPRIGSKLSLVRSLRLGRAPEPRVMAAVAFELGQFLWPKGACERTRWV